MKRITVLLLIVFSLFLFLGCAEAVIKRTISDFEDAINNESASDLIETLSTESANYVTDSKATDFLDYFVSSNFIPVDYRNLDISIDGRDADVYADGIYYAGGLYDQYNIWFWMKREQGFFSFLSPDWRVYKYFDDDNDDGVFQDIEVVWKKLKNKN